MNELQEIIPLPDVWTSMARVEERLLEVSTSDHAQLTEIAQHLLKAGGKRYRPLLAILAGQFGTSTDDKPIEAGVAPPITRPTSMLCPSTCTGSSVTAWRTRVLSERAPS